MSLQNIQRPSNFGAVPQPRPKVLSQKTSDRMKLAIAGLSRTPTLSVWQQLSLQKEKMQRSANAGDANFRLGSDVPKGYGLPIIEGKGDIVSSGYQQLENSTNRTKASRIQNSFLEELKGEHLAISLNGKYRLPDQIHLASEKHGVGDLKSLSWELKLGIPEAWRVAGAKKVQSGLMIKLVRPSKNNPNITRSLELIIPPSSPGIYTNNRTDIFDYTQNRVKETLPLHTDKKGKPSVQMSGLMKRVRDVMNKRLDRFQDKLDTQNESLFFLRSGQRITGKEAGANFNVGLHVHGMSKTIQSI